MLPIIFPSVVAGSVFTFSLILGDYITVQIVGGKIQLIGNVVYANIARPTTCPSPPRSPPSPSSIIVVYLLAVRRTGALENL